MPVGTPRELWDIEARDLRAKIEQLPRAAVDQLPFGVVRLDAERRVTYFSRTEALQSGFGDRNALGRSFFTELAPCMGRESLLRQIEAAGAAGTLDITFEHIGDFDEADRALRVRICCATGGGFWVFIQRESLDEP